MGRESESAHGKLESLTTLSVRVEVLEGFVEPARDNEVALVQPDNNAMEIVWSAT